MKYSLREIYGSVYLITFSDGTDIPFEPLSYGDFCYYSDLLAHRLVQPFIIEEEIFKKCVKDDAIINNIHKQKAGTITSTVSAIMGVSGPSTIEEFNNYINSNRALVDKPIHYLPLLICRAFPSYKPEDIDKMSFDTMMLRLAQAEKVLLDAGVLNEPIQLYENQPAPVKKQAIPQELKAIFDKSAKEKKNSDQQDPRPTKQEKSTSPALEKPHDTMSLLKDSISPEGEDAYNSDEYLQKKAVEDAKWIYKDLIQDLQKKRKK